MRSTRALAAVLTLITVALVLGFTPVLESQAADPPPANLRITGPDTIPLGTPAVFKAAVDGVVTTFAWAAGTAGSTIPGKAEPAVVTAAFGRAGAQSLKVTVSGPGGTLEATKMVNVTRPDLARVSISPRHPVAGQPVQIRLSRKAEPSRTVRYYSWRIAGVKPQTRTLKLGSQRVPSGARASATIVPAVEVRLAGAQPTAKPALTQTFSKPGVYPIRVGSMGADGRETITASVVKVGAAPITDEKFTSTLGTEPINVLRSCAALPTGVECPQITYDGDVLPNVVHTFTADPGQRFCIKGPTVPQWRANAGFTPLDLPYPSPEKFTQPAALQPGANAQAGAASAGRPRARASQTAREQCVVIPGDVLQWRFGDEEPKPELDSKNTAEPIAMHNYKKAGTYTLDVLSRVYVPAKGFLPLSFFGRPGTVKTANGDPLLTNAERQKLVDEGKLVSYFIVSQTQIDSKNPYCDLVRLNGIPSRAYVGEGNPFFSPDSCFLIENTPNGSGKPSADPEQRTYSLMSGASLSLNGIAVRTTNSDIRVDAGQDAIYRANPAATPAFDLTLYNEQAGPKFFAHLGKTQRIDVPDQAMDPDLKIKGSLLPDYGGKLSSGSMYGFPAKGARVLLRPDVPATAKVVLGIPEGLDLRNMSPLVIVGSPVNAKGTPGARAAGTGAPDFEMDLSGVSIGPIQTQDFIIRHFKGEGWEGGGILLFDFPGFKGDLQAKYFPDGGRRPKTCDELGKDAGPSGLKITDDGKLVHVGASLTVPITLGVVDITCIGAFFTQKPFAIQGLIEASAPSGTTAFTVDGCVQVAVLEPKESVLGCPGGSFGFPTPYTAGKSKETWLTVRAKLFALNKKIELAQGGFDLHTGNDVLNMSAFGTIPETYFGPWRINGTVEGLVVVEPEENAGFQVRGTILLAYGACPACLDVLGIVSSKGVGACVDATVVAGGFLYKFKKPNQGLKLYGGCDYDSFKPIAVKASAPRRSALTGVGPVGFASDATTEREVTIKPGIDGVTLDVESTDRRAPILTVKGPDGVITSPAKGDDGKESFFKSSGNVSFLVTPAVAYDRDPEFAISKGRTIVKLVKPKAGTYTITVQPGSPGIASLGRADKLPPRKITASFVKVKGERMLEYTVLPVPGQTVEFIESGAPVKARGSQAGRLAAAPFTSLIGEVGLPKKNSRGVLQAREGRLRLTQAYGTTGPRRVIAVISQDGVPIKEVEMTKARYTAPGPPKVPAPANVVVKRMGLGSVQTCWDRVPNARYYEVTVASSVGRVDLRRVPVTGVSKPCLKSTGFYADTATSVKVKAVTVYGESTTPPKGRVLPGRTPPFRRLILQP